MNSFLACRETSCVASLPSEDKASSPQCIFIYLLCFISEPVTAYCDGFRSRSPSCRLSTWRGAVQGADDHRRHWEVSPLGPLGSRHLLVLGLRTRLKTSNTGSCPPLRVPSLSLLATQIQPSASRCNKEGSSFVALCLQPSDKSAFGRRREPGGLCGRTTAHLTGGVASCEE